MPKPPRCRGYSRLPAGPASRCCCSIGVAAAVAAGVDGRAVVAGPELQPAVREPQRRGPGADRAGARGRRHSVSARRHRTASRCRPSSVQRCAPEARRPGPARRRAAASRSCRRIRASASASSWKARAISTRSKPSSRARSRACGRSKARACTSRCRAQSAFVRDRQPAERFGVRAAEGWQAPRAGTGPVDHQPRRLQHSRAGSEPGHRRRPAGPPALRAAGATASSRMREQQFELAQRLEEDYAQRIEALLTPFVGAGPRARAGRRAGRHVGHGRSARTVPAGEPDRAQRADGRRDSSRDGAGPQGVPGCAHEPAAARRARRCRRMPPLPLQRCCRRRAAAKAPGAAAANARRRAARQHFAADHPQLRNRSHRGVHEASRPAACSASQLRCSSTTCARPARMAKSRDAAHAASSSSTSRSS